MTRRRIRITWALPWCVAMAALAGGVLAYRTVALDLGEAGIAARDAAHVLSGLAVTLILLGVLAVACALLLARLIHGRLTELRGAVLGRARGDAVGIDTRWAELADLDQAVERLAFRVSEREAEMQHGGAQVTALLDAISEGILQLDGAGRIVRANPRCRVLLRLGSASVGQPAATQLRHAELRAILGRAIDGEPVDAEEIAFGERRLLVSARPLPPAPDMSGTGAVVAFVDLTEVRRLEGVRRDFVANVSHELKTPLTSIRGYTETILGDELPPELQRQFLEVIRKNADRLQRIVDDLLDLSRLESGGWRPEPQAVDAQELVEDVWSGCSDRARSRGITFVPPGRSIAVHADPGGLRQVLSNLLENSLRYTPDGGRIEVHVHDDASNGVHGPGGAGAVTLEVRDSGVGIPSDALPRIFERFYRVDPARSRDAGGTGLGLAIVKHLVESMGGDVGADSELGKGTTIRVRLPAA
jgi:two-component system, OmpR family, phosphate regulon sensor histidine kinase PhoR